MTKFGIDVSYAQGKIDWAKVANSNAKFVIIRLGYRGYGSGILKLDDYFEANINGALKAGIPVGLYFFTQAITAAEGKAEADLVLKHIKNRKITYPIYCDTEMANGGKGRADTISKFARTEAVKAFCKQIQNGGYKAGVYASTDWFKNKLIDSNLSDYAFWVAQYNSKCTYDGSYDMWQYGKESIAGISGKVDANYCYKDFEKGGTNTVTVKTLINPKPKKSTVQTVSVKMYGKNCKVTDHITLGELQCHNGADEVKIDWYTVNLAEAARVFFKRPIIISSAYRTPSYNKSVGGATGSYHVTGRAMDTYITGIHPSLLAMFYQIHGAKGIGCYYDDSFVHVDSRDTVFYWKNQSCTKVNSHVPTLKSGSSGQYVKNLQWLLTNAGYKTTIDGSFGMNTNKAVRNFQAAKGLLVDGIAGSKTFAKLLGA